MIGKALNSFSSVLKRYGPPPTEDREYPAVKYSKYQKDCFWEAVPSAPGWSAKDILQIIWSLGDESKPGVREIVLQPQQLPVLLFSHIPDAGEREKDDGEGKGGRGLGGKQQQAMLTRGVTGFHQVRCLSSFPELNEILCKYSVFAWLTQQEDSQQALDKIN